jgi:hypothetical protein
MSRWNETITLLSAPEAYQDDEGGWHEGERTEREVFCNPGIIGTMTMAQLRSSEVRISGNDNVPEVGLREMAMVYVRQIDYDNEDQCIYHGKEMDVIAATTERENWKLIIRRRVGND